MSSFIETRIEIQSQLATTVKFYESLICQSTCLFSSTSIIVYIAAGRLRILLFSFGKLLLFTSMRLSNPSKLIDPKQVACSGKLNFH